MTRRYRSPFSPIMVIAMFGGFELAEAIGTHRPSVAFGTWMAVASVGSIALRTPEIRRWLSARSLAATALVVVELTWAAMAAVALVVTLRGIDPADNVWVGAACVGLVLTPVALRRWTLAPMSGGDAEPGEAVGQPGPDTIP